MIPYSFLQKTSIWEEFTTIIYLYIEGPLWAQWFVTFHSNGEEKGQLVAYIIWF